MSTLTVQMNLDVSLPPDLCQRYGISPQTPLRVIETSSGILLVPLTKEPMDPQLEEELRQWQGLAAETLDQFPYEE